MATFAPGSAREGSAAARITPKIFILAMFQAEAEQWLSSNSAIQLTQQIELPGLSRDLDKVHSTSDGSVCLLITGMGLISAALSVSSLLHSDRFDLSRTYFVLTGIAGGNPRLTTLSSVALARYVIQVDTQMEWDAREIPSSWKTGYAPMGAISPTSFPTILHGTEVYELNDDLRQACMSFARKAALEDSAAAAETRAQYTSDSGGIYHVATLEPSVMEGDVLSSNTFWHGYHISEGMATVAGLYTSGKATYVMTAQEDSAILTALLRGALQGQVDFSRILLLRAASNFDREPSSHGPPELPWELDCGGLRPSLRNLYLTGIEIVNGILSGWDASFDQGIKPSNYVGDIFGSLGGRPDFMPETEVARSA